MPHAVVVVGPEFACPTVIARVGSVVGADDDHRVIQHTQALHLVHEPAEPRVHVADRARVERLDSLHFLGRIGLADGMVAGRDQAVAVVVGRVHLHVAGRRIEGFVGREGVDLEVETARVGVVPLHPVRRFREGPGGRPVLLLLHVEVLVLAVVLAVIAADPVRGAPVVDLVLDRIRIEPVALDSPDEAPAVVRPMVVARPLAEQVIVVRDQPRGHARRAQLPGHGLVRLLQRSPPTKRELVVARDEIPPRRHARKTRAERIVEHHRPRGEAIQIRGLYPIAAIAAQIGPLQRVHDDMDGVHIRFLVCAGLSRRATR